MTYKSSTATVAASLLMQRRKTSSAYGSLNPVNTYIIIQSTRERDQGGNISPHPDETEQYIGDHCEIIHLETSIIAPMSTLADDLHNDCCSPYLGAATRNLDETSSNQPRGPGIRISHTITCAYARTHPTAIVDRACSRKDCPSDERRVMQRST